MDNAVNGYIESLIKDRSDLLSEMETFAESEGVPIMELAGIETLLQLLRIQRPKKILEVGTAIGYSGLRMAEALPDAEIVTIERDEVRYRQALDFTGRSPQKEQLDIIFGDALEKAQEAEEKGPFDALFIDAAKGQYQKFFDLYSPFLAEGGVIYSDNVLFKGMVAEENVENKRIRNMVKKLRSYNDWLMNHPDYHTVIIPVGDGLAVSRKK
ncbi:O-methyltransferase [Rossellomorea vietnamensis]|uniref:tRNA 5-hydroxyuridine methyltransferase n=1 Tax=Rossellomorea vietnamensis TaxID=218284 RepID=A0A5D4MI11_9BACI|nr:MULTISPECIES: O-methyltransferase [Bacillaceae]TYS01019.1 O-methyltransferase [Rossellomorea vietnamensis]